MIRVLIAEDVHMLRGALVALLNLEPDIEIVAEVANGNDLLPSAVEFQPDVAVVDIDLPGVDGLSVVPHISKRLPETRILILTSLTRPGTVRRALNAKVSGFLLKDAPAHELVNAIRSVMIGRRVVDKSLALSAWDGDDCPLTARELEVLRMAASGDEAAEIARRLFLSVGTVRNYLTMSTNKLDARNRVDAIRIARESGWL